MQVAALLASLSIDPGSLPAELPHQAAPAEWAQLWAGQTATGRPPEPLVGADMASAAAAAAQRAAAASAAAGPAPWEALWDQQRQRQQQRPLSTGWADEYAVARQQQQAAAAAATGPSSSSWAQQFSEQQQQGAPASDWASEFESAAADRHGTGAAAAAASSSDARATSARLVEALSASGDPKMANSKFLQFLSKMSKGELEFEDNKVRDVIVCVSCGDV